MASAFPLGLSFIQMPTEKLGDISRLFVVGGYRQLHTCYELVPISQLEDTAVHSKYKVGYDLVL